MVFICKKIMYHAPTRNRSLAKRNGTGTKGSNIHIMTSHQTCFKEQLVTSDTFTIARDAVKVSTIRTIHYSWNIMYYNMHSLTSSKKIILHRSLKQL